MGVESIGFRKRLTLNVHRLKRNVEARLHELRYIFWECTLRCNLNCLHCGSDCQSSSSVPDMPLQDFLKVLDGLAGHIKPQKTTIAITGGEPLMRKDLELCGHELSKRQFPWGMVTNGYIMTEARFRALLEAGLRSITVSFDGTKTSHDWLRAKKGTYEKTYNTVKMVASAPNIIYDIVTCVNQRNIGQLEEIKKSLIDAGVIRWRLFTIFPKGRAGHNKDLLLKPKQFKMLMDFIESTRAEGKIWANYSCSGFLGDYEQRARDYLFNCHAGTHIGSVLVDGSISACPSLRADYIQGNIYKDDFWDVWANRFGVMRDRRWTKSGPCAGCDVYKWCKGNGLHLRDEKTGELLKCHYHELREAEQG